jgi:hypothetical protein
VTSNPAEKDPSTSSSRFVLLQSRSYIRKSSREISSILR